MGEDFWPTTYDPSVVDRVIQVSDAESFAMARRVTREEGLLIGGSCGTAVHAALVVGEELGPEAVVVVLVPDSGRNYLSKIFDDQWMIDFGFLRCGDGPCAGDVLAAKDRRIPDLVLITPDQPARRAIGMMRDLGISQLVVSVTTEQPLAAIRAYESQFMWNKSPVPEMVKTMNAYWGGRIETQYAEGFFSHEALGFSGLDQLL